MPPTLKKAVIPAAGLGTRFLPATKSQPKEMLPVVDKPAIQYVVEEAVRSGIDDILIITGRGKKAIEDHFDRSVELEADLHTKGKDSLLAEVLDLANLADIHYVRQGEALGLGHAVATARKHVGDRPFAVMLGDDIMDEHSTVLSEMIKHHVKEEERPAEGMFAQAREAGLDLNELAERLTSRKEELLGQIKSAGLPTLTTRSYTGHRLVQGSPVQASAAE